MKPETNARTYITIQWCLFLDTKLCDWETTQPKLKKNFLDVGQSHHRDPSKMGVQVPVLHIVHTLQYIGIWVKQDKTTQLPHQQLYTSESGYQILQSAVLWWSQWKSRSWKPTMIGFLWFQFWISEQFTGSICIKNPRREDNNQHFFFTYPNVWSIIAFHQHNMLQWLPNPTHPC